MATILVVDDDTEVLAVLRRGFECRGHVVVAAADGEQAVMLARRARPGAAVVDLRLPGVGGLGVLTALRADLPDIAAVVITGFSSKESAISALRAGASDYLEKPVVLDDLQRR